MSVQPSQRYQSLDVLRGVAILGTLATNIWIFTNPFGFIGYLAEPRQTGVATGWTLVERVLQQLAQGKFLALLTLMFGIGLEIQRRSALRHGLPWPGRYPWRAALLLLDGLAHFFLVVEFDVLTGYAVTGGIVAYLLITTERAQRRWMIITGIVHVTVITGLSLLLALAPTSGSTPPQGFNPYAQGSWFDLIQLRMQNIVIFRLEPVLISAYSIFMFLLGARLLRAGVLEASGGRLRRKLMIIGVIAFAVDLPLQVFGGDAGVIFGRYVTAALVALGILAAVTELVNRRRRARGPERALNRIGRMALSCYVAQNLIASVLCYGWGFGLAGRLPDGWRVPGTLIIFAVVAVLISIFAWLWQLRFRRGPIEIAWAWCYQRINALLGPTRPARELSPTGR